VPYWGAENPYVDIEGKCVTLLQKGFLKYFLMDITIIISTKSCIVGQFFDNPSREGLEPLYRGVGNYSFEPSSMKEVQCKTLQKGLDTMTFFTVYLYGVVCSYN
jgi:hypothetical protein